MSKSTLAPSLTPAGMNDMYVQNFRRTFSRRLHGTPRARWLKWWWLPEKRWARLAAEVVGLARAA